MIGHYKWKLSEVNFTKDKGEVFSCFSCGGGSTMGYKLTGFNVVGCNEIDEKIIEVYKKNHNPKYSYNESIVDFKKRDLYHFKNLTILDGSPPCSSFSMIGNRDLDWGKEKIFREGQKLQVLDTLFFDFIELAKKLKPKIIVAENVKGIIQGSAKKYTIKILKEFEDAGYYVNYYLLNSETMGICQSRERVFFIAIRKDLRKYVPSTNINAFNEFPFLDLFFNEKLIPYIDIEEIGAPEQKLFPSLIKYLPLTNEGCSISDIHEKGHMFSYNKVDRNKPLPTITAHLGGSGSYHYEVLRPITDLENILASSFPLDYNFLDVKVKYLVGMSVPPLMINKISDRIYEQWIKYFPKTKFFSLDEK